MHQRETEALIYRPLCEYSDFVRRAFGPFSGAAARTGNYEMVEKEAQDLSFALTEKVNRRRRDLTLGLANAVRLKVKLTTRDLKMALKLAAIMTEEFYPQHILNRVVYQLGNGGNGVDMADMASIISHIDAIHGGRKPPTANPQAGNAAMAKGSSLSGRKPHSGLLEARYATVEEWWDSKGLLVGDYAGLASLIFTEIFSSEFLTPMDDAGDTSFQMEVHGVSLARYTEMIRCVPSRPDLDEKLTVHAPRGNIHIHAPYLDLAAFTPLVRHGCHTQKAQKTSLAQRLSLRLNPGRRMVSRVEEKLLIPPPIPHPAHIAVIIHNREAQDAIPLDAPLTQQVGQQGQQG